MKRLSLMLSLLVLFAGFAFAGGSGESADVQTGVQAIVPRQGTTVNVALSENLISLDPLDQANIIGNLQNNLCLEPLVWYSNETGFIPCLATSSWADGVPSPAHVPHPKR